MLINDLSFFFLLLYIYLLFGSYRKWCSTEVFVPKQEEVDSSAFHIPSNLRKPAENPDESDPYHGYWAEYYDPRHLTTFDTLFAYNMNGTLKYRFPKVAINSHTCETEYVMVYY